MGVAGWFLTPRLMSARVPYWIALPIAGIAAVCVLIAMALPLGLAVEGRHVFDKAPTTWGAVGLVVETGLDMSATGVLAVLAAMIFLVAKRLKQTRAGSYG